MEIYNASHTSQERKYPQVQKKRTTRSNIAVDTDYIVQENLAESPHTYLLWAAGFLFFSLTVED